MRQGSPRCSTTLRIRHQTVCFPIYFQYLWFCERFLALTIRCIMIQLIWTSSFVIGLHRNLVFVVFYCVLYAFWAFGRAPRGARPPLNSSPNHMFSYIFSTFMVLRALASTDNQVYHDTADLDIKLCHRLTSKSRFYCIFLCFVYILSFRQGSPRCSTTLQILHQTICFPIYFQYLWFCERLLALTIRCIMIQLIWTSSFVIGLHRNLVFVVFSYVLYTFWAFGRAPRAARLPFEFFTKPYVFLYIFNIYGFASAC